MPTGLGPSSGPLSRRQGQEHAAAITVAIQPDDEDEDTVNDASGVYGFRGLGGYNGD